MRLMATTLTGPLLATQFATKLEKVLPRLLAPGALPDDWDCRATTYDLTRFDSNEAFASRFEAAVNGLLADNVTTPALVRERLVTIGLPFDYARLGQPLSTVLELLMQARTRAARCFSFASVTKTWLSVIESPSRTLPVRVYADGSLPVSDAKKRALKATGCTMFEGWSGPLPAAVAEALTIWVTSAPFTGDINTLSADAICSPVAHGGLLLLRDTARIAPTGIQLIRKRTVSALIASDALNELERAAHLQLTRFEEATPEMCAAKLRALSPQIRQSLYFCTGLAAEAAVFEAVGDVLGPEPVALFYAQNGYGGTGQLIGELLSRQRIAPAPLAVLGHDEQGRAVTLVDRIIASLKTLGPAPACIFLETPTNPQLQAHDFEALMKALREHHAHTGRQVPVIVDTTLAPLYPIFERDFSQGWPMLLVKSGSKYFTKGKSTLGVVACSNDPLALRIVARAAELGRDADSFAKPAQLTHLVDGLSDLEPRMNQVSANTIALAAGLRAAFTRRGHDVTLYSITERQVADGLSTGLLSFYLPPAPTTFDDLVDEFVDFLLKETPALVKSRVSYGQSTGGALDYFYVINPQESTQGALSAEVKAAQKLHNVQICRISVPAKADVAGLLAAIERFLEKKFS